MKRCYLGVLLLLVGARLGYGQAPVRYTVETEESRRISAKLIYTINCDQLRANQWILFIGKAPNLPGQSDVSTTLMSKGEVIQEPTFPHRSLLSARIKVEKKEHRTTMPIEISYQATLYTRRLKPLAPGASVPKVEPLSAKERKRYLAQHGDIDFRESAFQTWLEKNNFRREKQEDTLNFARRVFLTLRKDLNYKYSPTLDRHASVVCRTGKSDCGGMSCLYVAIMRANKIPARMLFGRWAQSAKKNEKVGGASYYQWHVKAEFFVNGVGWIPVDLASGIVHDRSPTGLRYFGNAHGQFLTVHIDTNFACDTNLFGVQSIHNLQTPAWWVTGQGKLEPIERHEDWQVKTRK